MYNAQQFIKAIKNSGGIITTIAARVGCDWDTAKKGRLNAAEWEFRRAWRGQVIVAQLAENIFCLLGVI
jgi:hypothetical protein